MSAVLDSGTLIAIDKRDRKIGAMLRALQRDGVPLRTSAVADAHVALLVRTQGTVLTSDEPDIRALLRTRRITADIARV